MTSPATPQFRLRKHSLILCGLLAVASTEGWADSRDLKLNDEEYFEADGLNVLVFSNWYNGLFSDSKISGVELIHHGMRTATNGDVRLNATPEQWDPIPTFIERNVDRSSQSIEARSHYPDHGFEFTIRARKEGEGVQLTIILDEALPKDLVGKAGFNLEFLPAAYFEKTWMMDSQNGNFPLYPSGPMEVNSDGKTSPLPLTVGKKLVLAPGDPERRVSIVSKTGELSLYDGRNKAQNGWFVVRGLLPADKTGEVLKWELRASTIPNWRREPVIQYSQVGYHPNQRKLATIELDKLARPANTAELVRFTDSGEERSVLNAHLRSWGRYKRYNYQLFDFSEITTPGVYAIRFQGQTSGPFRIAEDVYSNAWYPTLDVFFPVQMDHVLVNEAYRVWHGASHLDDALQAPVSHEHFDLYAQGPTTDTAFAPGDHIPGLNVGGWYDAGDFDIRTQTQYVTVLGLVDVWEAFDLKRDNTLVDYARKYVDIHVPDGKPDLLQQIQHGTLALIAQHRAVGHAIPGIIVPDISQYTHLGDGLTMTDNLIYKKGMGPDESDGFFSGKFDDRWAFTSRSSALNYGSIAALAAAHRALKGFDDELSNECLTTAQKVWNEESTSEPALFRHGNTTGGPLELEKLRAAVELLIVTGEAKYASAITESLPFIERSFNFSAFLAVKAMPHMDEAYKKEIRSLAENYRGYLNELMTQNPYGVPISEGGWAGAGGVISFANNNYALHKAFPDLIEAEAMFRGVHYIFGNHPAHNLSLVSAVGTQSKKVAYGANRADFSFIAGGIVPGILMLKPDFPENKEDWPFLWGENEYVINLGASYIYMVNAAAELLRTNR